MFADVDELNCTEGELAVVVALGVVNVAVPNQEFVYADVALRGGQGDSDTD